MHRSLSGRNIDYLANQIKTGKYKQTGDTIKISKTGRLLDGQHRLNAIIKANKDIEVTFCEGLDDDVFDVLDTGKNRSSGDILSIKKTPNPNECAAVATFLIVHQAGKHFNQERIYNNEILNFILNNESIPEIVKSTKAENKKFRMLSNSNIAALYFLFSKISQNECEEFFDKYFTGLDIEQNHPIYQLRDRLIKDSIAKTKIKPIYKMALVVNAWNKYRSKTRSLRKLDFELNVFPKIK